MLNKNSLTKSLILLAVTSPLLQSCNTILGASGSPSTITALVTSASGPITMSSLSDLNVTSSTSSSTVTVHFTLGGSSSLTCSSSTLTVASSNSSILSASAISISGTYPNCVGTVPLPASMPVGSTNLTFTATRGSLTASSKFTLNVSANPCTAGVAPFTYTGANQSFTLPSNCSGYPYVLAKLWGAGGGGSDPAQSGAAGGGGGYVLAQMQLQTSQAYTVLVGGGGCAYDTNVGDCSGGFGGGGTGQSFCGSGGGRSAIQLGSSDLLTAGAGGGGSAFSSGGGVGGAGGGNIGQTGGNSGATGGTQSAGGTQAASGSQYQGGTSGAGSAGGGGYFGGGAASIYLGGGGGSSYVGGAGVTALLNLQGNYQTQAQATDFDNGGAGLGGVFSGSGYGGYGGNGLVVIYYGACQVAAVSPSSASYLGGATITLTGLGFVSGTSVKVAGVPCTNVSVSSSNTLTCTLGATGSTGSAAVAVSCPGTQSTSLSGAFTYL